MTDFEDQLREALRPGEVPPGFAHRVLAKVPEAYAAPAARTAWRRVALWTSAAVVILAAVLTPIEVQHVRTERAKGEKAKQEVMLALRITGSKLNQAQNRVRQIGTEGERQ